MDWLSELLTRYTNLGEAGVIWIAIGVIFLFFKSTRKAGALALTAMLLCYIFNDMVVKNLVMRIRPFLTVAGLEALIEHPDSYSFPSGHACSSFAAAGVWAQTLQGRWAKAGRILLLVMAMLMALSRLYVGVHYPTDVLVGSLVGLAGSWMVCRWLGPVYDRLAGRRLSRRRAE